MRDRVVVDGRSVGAGSRVLLRPGLRRTDAQDLFLHGRTAQVEAVLHDVDGGVHLAVTVEGDPGADIRREQGRFLYFQPDEVTPLEDAYEPPPAGRPQDPVAGIGNIFLGDDGFGVETVAPARRAPAARRRRGRRHRGARGAPRLPAAGRLRHRSSSWTPPHAAKPPAPLYLIEPRRPADTGAVPAIDGHHMTPDTVLALLGTLCAGTGGHRRERVLVVGCEPAYVEEGIGLSAPVSAAVRRGRPADPAAAAGAASRPWRSPTDAIDVRKDTMKKLVLGGAALAAVIAVVAERTARRQALPADPTHVNRRPPVCRTVASNGVPPAGDGVPGRRTGARAV